MANLRCSLRLWISRSLLRFIPLSSPCTSLYRSQADCFSYRGKGTQTEVYQMDRVYLFHSGQTYNVGMDRRAWGLVSLLLWLTWSQQPHKIALLTCRLTFQFVCRVKVVSSYTWFKNKTDTCVGSYGEKQKGLATLVLECCRHFMFLIELTWRPGVLNLGSHRADQLAQLVIGIGTKSCSTSGTGLLRLLTTDKLFCHSMHC